MSETVVTLTVYIAPFVAAMGYGIWKAHRNGRTGRPNVDRGGHVRLVDPSPSPIEDVLRMSWWDVQRDRIDGNGRTHKVGVDHHSGLCWDGKRLTCQCRLQDAEGEVPA